MEIMGVTIRTIVNDNVAIRCDGCREIIPGTPWRVNLLDIVSPEVAVGWAESTPLNPGPHQFHSDPACVRRWMAERGHLFIPILIVLGGMSMSFSAPLCALFGALAYFILPFDAIPDMLVGVGFTDDAAIMVAAGEPECVRLAAADLVSDVQ